jgi:hypothetical protein
VWYRLVRVKAWPKHELSPHDPVRVQERVRVLGEKVRLQVYLYNRVGD